MYNTDYLKVSAERFAEQRKEFVMRTNIKIYVKDKISNNIKIENVLDMISTSIPSHLLSEVDSIYVGMFDDFKEKEISAAFKDGAIYVSNMQEDEQDLIDDLVHEVAHSLEAKYGFLIYGDDKLKSEFLIKRKKLFDILKSEELSPDKELFLDFEYSTLLDNYLYKTVGYDRLNFISASYGLFTSAYSATSLKEYYANGFEYYFLENPKELSDICPELYKKIEELHYYED